MEELNQSQSGNQHESSKTLALIPGFFVEILNFGIGHGIILTKYVS